MWNSYLTSGILSQQHLNEPRRVAVPAAALPRAQDPAPHKKRLRRDRDHDLDPLAALHGLVAVKRDSTAAEIDKLNLSAPGPAFPRRYSGL